MLKHNSLHTLVTLAVLLQVGDAAAVPGQIAYTGHLTKGGKAVTTASLPAIFKIYPSLTGGKLLWQDKDTVKVNSGVFHAVLGESSPLTASVLDGSTRYLEVALGNQTMSPRLPLRTAPYAMTADNCTGNITPKTVAVGLSSPGKYTPVHVRTSGASGQAPVSPHVYGLFVENGLTGNDNCVFQTATKGGGKSFTITSAGNVGIGAPKPKSKLHIEDNSTVATAGPYLQLVNNAASGGRSAIVLASNVPKNISYSIAAYTDDKYWTNGLVFFAGNKKLMVMKSDGKVGVGTASPTALLDVAGNTKINGSLQATSLISGAGFFGSWDAGDWGPAQFDKVTTAFYQTLVSSKKDYPGNHGTIIGMDRGPSSNYEYSYQIYRMYGANDDLYFRSGRSATKWGTWQKFSMVSTSSRRFKENLAPIRGALKTVQRLKGYTFDWKKEHGGKHDVGLVAEEVKRVLPEVVEHEAGDSRPKYLRYEKIVPVLVEAIKEQQQEITGLRREVRGYRSLKKEVRELRRLVGALARRSK